TCTRCECDCADKMADVTGSSSQAPAVAPPVRTDEEIVPRKRAFTASSTIPAIYIQQFWDTIQYEKKAGSYRCQLDEQWFVLTKDTLREALQITPINNNQAFIAPPLTNVLVDFVNKLGYPKLVRNVSNVVTNDMFQPWRALTTIINLCLTGKTSGFERPRALVLQILWGIVTQSNIDYAERIWEEFTQSIHTFIEDNRNLSWHTSGKKRATLIVIPSIRYTKLIIHHLQRKHRFHLRPDSPLYLSNKEPVLGYLKFSAKGTKSDVFGMPIPDSLISAEIQQATYYREYMEKVTHHRKYMAGETGGVQNPPAPKPTQPVRKPNAPTRPSISIPPKSSPKSVGVSKTKEVPKVEPQVADEDADYQKALEESMKDAYALPKGPLPPMVIREPESGKYQPLPEVPGKGKAKGGQDEGQSGPDPDAQAEDQTGSDAGAQAERQAGSNADETFEGQARSNPDETSKGQAGPDPGDTEAKVSITVSEVVTDAVDWAMQAPLHNRFRDLPEAAMKEILHQRMWESDSYKSHEDHMQLFEALEKSMNRNHSEELAQDLAEARKKKKKSRESPKPPPGSPSHQPPPPLPPTGPSGASRAPSASGSAQMPPSPPLPSSTNQESPFKGSATPSPSKTATSAEYQTWMTTDIRLRPSISLTPADLKMDGDMAPDEQVQSSDDEDIGSAHIPMVNLRQGWWKPFEEERPTTPEPTWSIRSSDVPVPTNNWASALASNYSPPSKDSLLVQTGDIATFIDWFCKRQGITELKPQNLERPAYEIVKVFHPDVIHLQYQMKECHKLLTDSVDDPILRHNVSKPLPLGGPPGQVTIQSDFFFNKDLEYLRYGSKGRRPALSISKMKTTYYPDAGLEQLVPDQFWIEEECKYDIAAMYGISHWWF
nr:monodehydroascorbate reductase [Tanacetum cinerariifolium]